LSEASGISLPILGPTEVVGSTLGRRLESLRTALLPLDEEAAARRFDLSAYDRLLKSTISLCPACLEHVEALVYSRNGRVWIRKRCPSHGPGDALLENDERFYFLSNKDRWGRRYAPDRVREFPAFAGTCCGGECGDAGDAPGTAPLDYTDQLANKTCTVLVEITNACNLSCKVCYSDAKGDRVMPLAVVSRYLRALIERKGTLDSVQLTGGEALLHPQFWETVDFLHREQKIRKIYLPTNGILLARPENARRLAPFRDKLMVLLQFDGRTAEANQNLRNANPTRIRQEVIARLAEQQIVMQLTMTLTKGVNDAEVGWVIDTALRHRHIKVVALQPVTYSGRYELAREPVERLTLSDVVKCVIEQAAARMRPDDFVPIPCSHPNCGWLTLLVRRFGLKVNVARHIDVAAVTNQVAYKTVLSQREIREMVGSPRPGLVSRLLGSVGRRIVRPTDLFGIAVKPFMDCFNYDQDRISNCCHHLLNTEGQAVSFCEYNARLRQTDPWDRFPALAET
jgi:uncharacterized radical SAM superfamily Fe-S cluster-containing enzyme